MYTKSILKFRRPQEATAATVAATAKTPAASVETAAVAMQTATIAAGEGTTAAAATATEGTTAAATTAREGTTAAATTAGVGAATLAKREKHMNENIFFFSASFACIFVPLERAPEGGVSDCCDGGHVGGAEDACPVRCDQQQGAEAEAGGRGEGACERLGVHGEKRNCEWGGGGKMFM